VAKDGTSRLAASGLSIAALVIYQKSCVADSVFDAARPDSPNRAVQQE
jgi:hypothetical protein